MSTAGDNSEYPARTLVSQPFNLQLDFIEKKRLENEKFAQQKHSAASVNYTDKQSSNYNSNQYQNRMQDFSNLHSQLQSQQNYMKQLKQQSAPYGQSSFNADLNQKDFSYQPNFNGNGHKMSQNYAASETSLSSNQSNSQNDGLRHSHYNSLGGDYRPQNLSTSVDAYRQSNFVDYRQSGSVTSSSGQSAYNPDQATFRQPGQLPAGQSTYRQHDSTYTQAQNYTGIQNGVRAGSNDRSGLSNTHSNETLSTSGYNQYKPAASQFSYKPTSVASQQSGLFPFLQSGQSTNSTGQSTENSLRQNGQFGTSNDQSAYSTGPSYKAPTVSVPVNNFQSSKYAPLDFTKFDSPRLASPVANKPFNDSTAKSKYTFSDSPILLPPTSSPFLSSTSSPLKSINSTPESTVHSQILSKTLDNNFSNIPVDSTQFFNDGENSDRFLKKNSPTSETSVQFLNTTKDQGADQFLASSSIMDLPTSKWSTTPSTSIWGKTTTNVSSFNSSMW